VVSTFGPSAYGPEGDDPNESFSALTDDLSFSSYGPSEGSKTDREYVTDYINSKTKLHIQVEFLRSHKRKPQGDKGLVEDYAFAIDLHDRLLERDTWPVSNKYIFTFDHQFSKTQTNTGRVRAAAVKSALDISDTWLSKARKVIEILDEMGPDGREPDPVVVARMRSKSQRKGTELYRFLMDRREGLKSA